MSLQWVFKPTMPYTTCTPARRACGPRDVGVLVETSLDFHQSQHLLAGMSGVDQASMIGELELVRYRVCLMASTFGSAAACARKACTEVEKES